MFQRILLAYNGSLHGKSALLACVEIASFANVEAHLLAVIRLPVGVYLTEGSPTEQLLDDETERAHTILNEGVEQLQLKGINAIAHLRLGEPVAEICYLAIEIEADLIVVGHKKRASFTTRWWSNPVGKSLLDHSPCSVFIAQTQY